MSAFTTAVRLDVRTQYRHGFYYATLFSLLPLEVLLLLLPADLKPVAMPYTIFGDSVIVGFFFVAGAMFFEKGERTLSALFTTPMRFRDYLASKLTTMMLLSIGATLFITAVTMLVAPEAFRDSGFSPLMLLAGVVLCSLIMLLCGLISSMPFASITDWLIPSLGVIIVTNVPLLYYSGLWEHPVLYALPTLGSLFMLGSAFGQTSVSGLDLAYAIGYQLLWIAILALVARKAFDRFILAKEGSR